MENITSVITLLEQKRAGRTISDLAKEMGLKEVTLGSILRRRSVISVPILRKIHNAYPKDRAMRSAIISYVLGECDD